MPLRIQLTRNSVLQSCFLLNPASCKNQEYFWKMCSWCRGSFPTTNERPEGFIGTRKSAWNVGRSHSVIGQGCRSKPPTFESPPKNCEFLHVFLGGRGHLFSLKKTENHTPLVAGACCCNFLVGNGQIHPQKLAPFHLSQPRWDRILTRPREVLPQEMGSQPKWILQ